MGQGVPSGWWRDGGENATITSVQVPLLLLADFANVADGNKLNILGVFTSILSETFPCVHPQMALIAQFRAERTEYGTFELAIRVLSEDGETVFEAKGNLEIPKGQFTEKTIAQVFQLNGLSFKKPGEYSIVAFINGEERNRYALLVQQQTAQPKDG